MQKDIETAKLSKWKTNHAQNQDLEFITRSALIKIEELKTFIATAESQNADCIRFYFVRYEIDESMQKVPDWRNNTAEGKSPDVQQQTDGSNVEASDLGDAVSAVRIQEPPQYGKQVQVPEGCVYKHAGNGLTQGSIALVPAKKFKIDKSYIFSAEDIVHKNKLTVLVPGIDYKGTGHCPPCDE